jgi:hypothetical protein
MKPDSEHDTAPRQIGRALWLLAAPVLAVGMIAMAAGVVVGASSTGTFGTGFYVALVLALAVLALAAWLIRRILPAYALPRSPRMRGARLTLYASGVVGILIGVLAIVLQPGRPQAFAEILTGPAPISPALAILFLAGFAASLALSVRWHMLLDEHERAAYDFGAVSALYVYFGLSAGWWVLWRADLTTAPDGLIIFATVTATWMVGWLYRRFR